MTKTQGAVLARDRSEFEPLLRDAAPGGRATPVTTADLVLSAAATLAVTAHRRKAEAAARHTELRRRMRALARAARRPIGP